MNIWLINILVIKTILIEKKIFAKKKNNIKLKNLFSIIVKSDKYCFQSI